MVEAGDCKEEYILEDGEPFTIICKFYAKPEADSVYFLHTATGYKEPAQPEVISQPALSSFSL